MINHKNANETTTRIPSRVLVSNVVEEITNNGKCSRRQLSFFHRMSALSKPLESSPCHHVCEVDTESLLICKYSRTSMARTPLGP